MVIKKQNLHISKKWFRFVEVMQSVRVNKLYKILKQTQNEKRTIGRRAFGYAEQ